MRTLLFTSLFVLQCSTVFAGFRETLLDRDHRPTVADFVEALGSSLPQNNPFTPCLPNDPLMPLVSTAGPTIIADLEYSFPGATWAPLGRDSSLVGDVLETYALHHGQAGRVVRLNASGNSFGSPAHYLGLLQTAELVNEKGKPEENFVIVDPTSWGTASQIRRLITSVYGPLSHAERKEMLSKVNAMALGTSSRASGNLKPVAQNWPSDILSRMSFESDGAPSAVLSTTGELSYPGGCAGVAEMAWHQTFQPFVFQNGHWISYPGARMPEAVREHVLWRMYEIKKLIDSPQFQASADQMAKARLNFDLTRSIQTNFVSKSAIQALPEEGPALEQALRDMILASQNTSTPQRVRGTFGYALKARVSEIANLQLTPQFLLQVSSLMNVADQEILFWESIATAPSLERALVILENTPDHSSSKTSEPLRDKFAANYLSSFMAQKPSVEQINRYSRLVSFGSKVSEQIAIQALQTISTREEYQTLRTSINPFKSKEYKSALKEFNKSHPKPKRTLREIFTRKGAIQK